MGIAKILVIILVLSLIGVGIAGYFIYIKDRDSFLQGPSPSVSPAVSSAANKNLDTDKDGLSDVIESAIGTDATKADTDGDGYDDLSEIKNGYDPRATTKEKLAPEAWQALKDAIKAEDKEFYEKTFGSSILLENPDSAISTFKKLKEAYEKKDFEAYKNLMLKNDVIGIDQMMSGGWNYVFPEGIEFIEEYKKGENNIITAEETDKDGNKEEMEYVFAKEEGAWKVDLNATLELNMNKPPVIKSTTGIVDFQVLDIVTSPNPPKAGDKKTEIEARVKNIGTKTFIGTLKYKSSIAGSGHPGEGSLEINAFNPGYIMRLSIPYDFYLFFTKDNTAGNKDVYFEINHDKKVSESNYDNNSVRQKIEFVQ